MAKRLMLVFLGVMVVGMLVSCGGSPSDSDAQATAIVAAAFATLTAEAQPVAETVTVVTPPPPPTAPPTAQPIATKAAPPLRVEADGSGDVPTLAEALIGSEVGATITLGPGVYRLDEVLTVAGSLYLIGAGRDRTAVVASVAGHVLRFEGDGPFSVQGITFRHEGPETADVIAVSGGAVEFRDCRFLGGVWDDERGGGSGLLLEGMTTGSVTGCEAVGNELHGYHLREGADVVLENNRAFDNGDSGLVYFDQAGGLARGNDCSRNGVHGIYADDEAAPILESNQVRDNGDSGIAYFGRVAGTLRANVCSGNAYHGIYAGEDAAPSLADNACGVGGNVVLPEEPGSVGGRIVFVSNRDGDADIYAMNADGSGVERITARRGMDDEPSWSPDGNHILFVSNAQGSTDLYVMNADGSGAVRLTDDEAWESSPSWSPDGSHVAFSSERDGDREIYVMNVDGSNVQQLTVNEDWDDSPAWSPDGTRLAYVSGDAGWSGVYVMNADGSGSRPLSHLDPLAERDVSWSPDGSRIAFVVDDTGDSVVVVNVAGTWEREVKEPAGLVNSLSWSPDGTGLVIGFENAIQILDLRDNSLVRLTDSDGEAWGPDWWSPPPSSLVVEATVTPLVPGPRFNPEGNPWCYNQPSLALDKEWQVSAPREVVVLGDAVEIGLRNKWGVEGETYEVRASVVAPDGSQARAYVTVHSDEWANLRYPDDFFAVEGTQRGVYTIIWESDGFLACDGFSVAGGAGW